MTFKIVTKYTLGLSATMKRKDGLTKVIKMFLGKVVVKKERKGEDNVVVKTINYTVKNLSEQSMSGMATFQVYPAELKDFMTKMNCFCYEEQTLKGGEKEKYSLVLLIDPKVTKNIKEAIIQFIFFKKWF